MKVFSKEDCGNAPKKQLLKDFHIALTSNDIDFILDNITDNIVWEWVGDKELNGKDAIHEQINQWSNKKINELHLHHIITHGKTAAANGTIVFDNDEVVHFSNVFEFNNAGKNAKLKEWTSYIIC
ncbi:nuclear transport factor 2 family protein [Ornithinibacillus halophilus]|uniref:SnoaL-like domain-containing protein n=1 Tax=Ornithinibacillus halophilus TaxID=930117 RepID=A0A1M5K4A1_9BACI|nr:nuclear transport factor 2 family protein [Ornithinibacillus halophilus]SHG47585.1 SnoaL-like domain-containing protein [Ornithinibacillus halophilus]